MVIAKPTKSCIGRNVMPWDPTQTVVLAEPRHAVELFSGVYYCCCCFVPFCAIKPKNLLKQGPDTNCVTVVIFDVFLAEREFVWTLGLPQSNFLGVFLQFFCWELLKIDLLT